MTVEIPPDVRQYVEDQVAAGAYANEREVIADALRVLRELRERHESLRADIQTAIAQSRNRESRPLDAAEIKAEGRRRTGPGKCQ